MGPWLHSLSQKSTEAPVHFWRRKTVGSIWTYSNVITYSQVDQKSWPKMRCSFYHFEAARSCLLLFSRWVVSHSLGVHGLRPSWLLCPWDSPGKNTGVGCHFLLQGIFPTQGLNQRLLHWMHRQADSLPLSHQGSPANEILLWIEKAEVITVPMPQCEISDTGLFLNMPVCIKR